MFLEIYLKKATSFFILDKQAISYFHNIDFGNKLGAGAEGFISKLSSELESVINYYQI